MDLSIRLADPSDATDIARVYLSSRKKFLPFAPLVHSDAEVHGWVRDVLVPSGQVFAALMGDKIVGMMATSRSEGIGWVDHLYLLPGWSGRGIGERLLQTAKRRLGPPLRLYTFQQNYGARRFYARLGFRDLELSDGSGNEERTPDVLMEWLGDG